METVVTEEVVSSEDGATAAEDALVEEVPEVDSGRPPPLIVPCNWFSSPRDTKFIPNVAPLLLIADLMQLDLQPFNRCHLTQGDQLRYWV